MTFSRRAFVVYALAIPSLSATRLAQSAADFPTKNIQFVIPYAAGGGFDTYVRVVGPVMEKHLRERVNIIPFNVPAGGGSRGATRLFRARPDGYTIGILNIPGLFILQEQQGSSAYEASQFTWIGAIGEGERYALCVSAKSPLKTYADLKALSAKRPLKFSVTGPQSTAYAATVIGTSLLGLNSKMITGYRGSAEYIVAAVRGDGDAVITTVPSALRYERGGSIRVLATFERQSSFSGIPDANALGEPELDSLTVERLVAAPPGLPGEIVGLLSAALAKAVTDPTVVGWGKQNDVVMRSATPQQTVAIVEQQRAFFEKYRNRLSSG